MKCKKCYVCNEEAEYGVCEKHYVEQADLELYQAGHLLIDQWSKDTEGINQCVNCGKRNIWLGICPDCQKKEVK